MAGKRPAADPVSFPSGARRSAMDEDAAATLALQALAFLADSGDCLERFARVTGCDRAVIRDLANEADFLASVLDFLLANERLVTEFCQNTSIPAASVHTARRMLAGG